MAKTKAKTVETKKFSFSTEWFKKNWLTIFWSFILVAFVVTFATLIGLSVAHSQQIVRKADGSIDGFKYDTAKSWFEHEEDATWGGLPAGYKALFFGGIALAIIVIIGVGGWLRGSRWINRSNPYIKGQVYVRTKFQTIVFRTLTLCLATIFLWSFFMDTAFADFLREDGHNDGAGNFPKRIWAWATNLNIWYYQCFVTSFILGWAIVFKKYNWIKVVFPMGFIGALRTFGDITDWVGDAGGWENISFHRMAAEHLMLILGPIFILVANRDRYTLKNIKATVAYTFILVFIPYVIYTVASWGRDDRTLDVQSWGEISGVATWWKLGGATEALQTTWLHEHWHLFFWCMYVPFGVAIVALLIFTVNYFQYKSEAEGNWGRRWLRGFKDWGKDIKHAQWKPFLASFTNFTSVFRHRKEKPVPFGVDPKVWEEKRRK